ncbi:LysR family transcriptional regulator ArgP [Rhizobium sp. P40RR-XXII]|uniref:LysR family transcriptional regulator ArgP n=1 Tax=Rhizobium sp. P40RR-XXII TaxID=2726739 RepID=UPI00145771A2|nr:LysR family transcriptional regulator ArgP [Rhizobium sp. P40RR-XXII]NLS21141.1 LysR family transcriptional regulator ArgP [Rhizobium sp. P40RR-XXII]
MLDRSQLEALVTIVRYGNFDRAAKALNVTPSAVSQRIRALEEKVGAVLIVRGQPCRATPVGEKLFRYAEDVGLLEQGLLSEINSLSSAEEQRTVAIAVNADSLATWFPFSLSASEDILYNIVCEDQEHTADLLKSGLVSAAISGHGHEVAGCGCRLLGNLRYRAVATPDFISRYFPDGVTPVTAARAPGLLFNNKDNLLSQWSERCLGYPVLPPTHWLPSTDAIVQATLRGLGWGINPEHLVEGHLKEGELAEIIPDQPFDVPLFWHWSRAVERILAPLTASVRETARKFLA